MRRMRDGDDSPAFAAGKGAVGALCLLMALGALLTSLPAHTDSPNGHQAPWLSQITPLSPRPSSGLEAVKLQYEVSWSDFLGAGTIELDFRPHDSATVQASARAGSRGLVRAIWSYDSTTSTQVSYKDLIPQHFRHVQTEDGVKAEYDGRYHDGRMRIDWSITPKNGKGAEHKTLIHDVDEIRDVLSTLLYLQRTKLENNRSIVLLVQPSERLYRVSFRVLGREPREVEGRMWKTIKLGVTIRSVTDDLELAPYTKMRRTSMWISDDAYRVPVAIEADLFFGYVSVGLTSRTPLSR